MDHGHPRNVFAATPRCWDKNRVIQRCSVKDYYPRIAILTAPSKVTGQRWATKAQANRLDLPRHFFVLCASALRCSTVGVKSKAQLYERNILQAVTEENVPWRRSPAQPTADFPPSAFQLPA